MIQIKALYGGKVSTKGEISLTDFCDLHHYFSLSKENLEQDRGKCCLCQTHGSMLRKP